MTLKEMFDIKKFEHPLRMSNIRIRQDPRLDFTRIKTRQQFRQRLIRFQHRIKLKCIIHFPIIRQRIYQPPALTYNTRRSREGTRYRFCDVVQDLLEQVRMIYSTRYVTFLPPRL